MAYEHAEHSLSAEEARVLKHFHDEATGSEYLVIAWTGLERDYFDEYKAFLQAFTWPSNFETDPNTPARVVDQPEIGPEQVPFPGAWMRSSVAAADDDSSELVLTLLRVYDSVKDAAGIYSRAVLLNREQYKASEKALVLQFRNLDPRKLKEIVDRDLVADSFAGIQTGNETYSGTWYNRQAPQATDESGGGVITWMLMKHQNDDEIYTWFRTPTERVVYFFKHHMLPAGWKEFHTDYYFTPDGHVYVSAEGTPGTGAYTMLDGEAAEGILPEDAQLLNRSVSGRLVDGLPQYREDDQTNELRITLVFNVGLALPENWNNGDFVIEYGEPKEITRLICPVIADELPDNLSLVGSYKDIAAETGQEGEEYGTHGLLTGRRMIRRTTRNERLTEDLRYSYDIIEVEQTAPIEENDGWFSVGQSTTADPEDNRLSTYRIQDVSIDQINTLGVPRWRIVTVDRFRKFFIDQPTAANLTAAQATRETDPDYSAPTGGNGPDTVYVEGSAGRLHFIEKRVTVRGPWQVWNDGGQFSFKAYNGGSLVDNVVRSYASVPGND